MLLIETHNSMIREGKQLQIRLNLLIGVRNLIMEVEPECELLKYE